MKIEKLRERYIERQRQRDQKSDIKRKGYRNIKRHG